MSQTNGQRWSTNRMVGAAFGGVYVLVGLLGFAVTQGVDVAATDGGHLLGIFEVNPLHNLVHVAIGVALLAAARYGPVAARAVNGTVGGTYLLVGVIGLFVLGSGANILALNGSDNGLHFATAAVLLGASVALRDDARTVPADSRVRIDA